MSKTSGHLAVDVRYPNRRLSGAEFATERIVIIPAERSDFDKAKLETREALEWLISNLDVCLRLYDDESVFNLDYLRSPKNG